jgi:acetyl esterase/lipase
VLALAGTAGSVSLWLWHRSHKRTFTAEKSLFNALQDLPMIVRPAGSLIASPAEQFQQHAKNAIASRAWLRPFSYSRQGVERLADIRYGKHPRLQLDIYRPTILPAQPAPVLLHIHGGGWIMGNKHQQAQPLLRHMAARGWICVDINYRLAPRYRYPECLIDAKRALAWIKREIAQYGGNPDFVAVTGGSAGGHLAAMVALTANASEFQRGFAEVDTRAQAAVLMYGAYDFTNSNANWAGAALVRYLRKFVMPRNSRPENFRDASPKCNLSESAPPTFVIHGSNDALISVADARDFVATTKAISSAPVIYAELDGAQHGFDLFHSVRTEFLIRAVERFLEFVRSSK